MYTLLYQLYNWVLVVSMHGKYRISDRVSKGGQIYLDPWSNDYPSTIIISNDNPWLSLTPVTIHSINLTIHRNWYIKISQLTSPYIFALANHDRLLETNLKNGYTYSNREMTISFKKHAHVHFVSSQSFNSDSFKGFFDWLLGFYDHSTTIRLPYHMIVLSEEGEETTITYTDDTQTQTWNISSRVTQEDLV